MKIIEIATKNGYCPRPQTDLCFNPLRRGAPLNSNSTSFRHFVTHYII